MSIGTSIFFILFSIFVAFSYLKSLMLDDLVLLERNFDFVEKINEMDEKNKKINLIVIKALSIVMFFAYTFYFIKAAIYIDLFALTLIVGFLCIFCLRSVLKAFEIANEGKVERRGLMQKLNLALGASFAYLFLNILLVDLAGWIGSVVFWIAFFLSTKFYIVDNKKKGGKNK